jgi:hypothetical protein
VHCAPAKFARCAVHLLYWYKSTNTDAIYTDTWLVNHERTSRQQVLALVSELVMLWQVC